jgi:predicted kinase
VVRKELAQSSGESGIYTPEWNERTYAECLRRAEQRLFEGKRVLVDATFREENKRRRLLDAAVRLGVPTVLFICRAAPEVVRERLQQRRNDVSDADWSIHAKFAAEWEQPGERTRQAFCEIVTNGNRELALAEAIEELRTKHLLEVRIRCQQAGR